MCVCVGKPKAVVTLHPDLQQIFTGERLTLSCQIQGGEYNTEWWYFFKRDDVAIGRSRSELKIESAEESHRGAYTCVGKNTSNEYSDWSDEVKLTVTGMSAHLPQTDYFRFSITSY